MSESSLLSYARGLFANKSLTPSFLSVISSIPDLPPYTRPKLPLFIGEMSDSLKSFAETLLSSLLYGVVAAKDFFLFDFEFVLLASC